VGSFVKRHAEHHFKTESIPQKHSQLEVPRVVHEAAIDGFRECVYKACTELEFDLGEIEISEWEDRTEGRVIVPSAMRWQTIYHGTSRNLKHISVVVFISAAG
jgi:hypothetical protein